MLQHNEQTILCGVETTSSSGVATKTHIPKLLHRLLDRKASTVPLMDGPQVLIPSNEPRADVERYHAYATEPMHGAPPNAPLEDIDGTSTRSYSR